MTLQWGVGEIQVSGLKAPMFFFLVVLSFLSGFIYNWSRKTRR